MDEKKLSLWDWFYRLSIGLFIVMALAAQADKVMDLVNDWSKPKIKIAQIYVRGMIDSAPATVRQLRSALKDGSVKGVFLKIDCGGGAAGSSELIFREVLRLRQHGKPVIALVENLCASGAYLIACASNKIICQESSIVGSIGVYLTIPKIKKLLDSWHVDMDLIAKGEHKVATHFASGPLTERQRALLDRAAGDTYKAFVNRVVEMRGLELKEQKVWAEGKIFSGAEALELGLVDLLGDFGSVEEQFLLLLNEPAGKEMKFVAKPKPSGLARLFKGSGDEDDDTVLGLPVKSLCRHLVSACKDVVLEQESIIQY